MNIVKYNTETFREAAYKKHNGKYGLEKAFFINRNTKTTFICPVHGEFCQTPAAHLQGQGCPECGKERIGKYKKISQEEIIERFIEIHGKKYDYSKFMYVNMHTKGTIICPEHGEFQQTPMNHLSGCGCPKCAGFGLTREEVIAKFNKIHNNKYVYTETFFDKLGDKCYVECPKHGKFKTTPSKHIEGRGCPKCALEYTAKINKVTNEEFIERATEIHGSKYLYDRLNVISMQHYVDIGCPQHGYFKQMANEHLRGRGCPICGNHVSHAEEEIIKYIKELLGEGKVITRDRSVLDGRELDIYIPSKKLSIEYNGNYWHSEGKGRDSKYHITKLNKCNEKGISLLQIFEDEWVEHKEIVLSKIRHIIGLSDINKRIYGRNCHVKEIDKNISKKFLEENHIQGNGVSSIQLGCFYNDTLVGVMTFKRVKNGEWELNRFASDVNQICIGIGGKLFKYFLNEYKPLLVKSFADRRWSLNKDNNLYTKLGFKLEKIIPPDYRYVKASDIKRYHKFNFRKQILHEKYGLSMDLTETEMCKQLNFHRIWDCGLFKYVWEKT